MKISNSHQRIVAATPDRVTALVADFDAVWPTHVAPAPRMHTERLYEIGPMLWAECQRPGAIRAFRVINPEGLQADHWFELERVNGGTLLRHTVDGEAQGKYEAIWRDRIEPFHDRLLEALFDNVETALAAKLPQRRS